MGIVTPLSNDNFVTVIEAKHFLSITSSPIHRSNRFVLVISLPLQSYNKCVPVTVTIVVINSATLVTFL